MKLSEKVVWKYPLPSPLSNQRYELPRGHKVVGVGIQDGRFVAWLEVYANAPKRMFEFLVRPTGFAYPNDYVHCGIIHQDDLVWHVLKRMLPETDNPDLL